jgi:hypothetical protein
VLNAVRCSSLELSATFFAQRIADTSTTKGEPTNAERFRECLERYNPRNVWFVSELTNQRQEARNIAARPATDLSTLREAAQGSTTIDFSSAGFVRTNSSQ